MGHGDAISAGKQLFARINTVGAQNGQVEKLDAQEVEQAKAFGFSLFNLTNNMTEEEFVAQYENVEFNNKQEEDAFIQQERGIHVKYIQQKYGVKTEIQDGESIEQFEARVQDEGLNSAIDKHIAEIRPDFGLGKNPPPEQEEYVEPDPTMCRDPKTHDW